MKLNWNFLGGGGANKNLLWEGGSMDIFWNCTFDLWYNFSLASVIVALG